MNHSIKRRLLQVRKAATMLRTSTYEISSRCNLTCEGCLFFSGEHAYQHAETDDYQAWRAFFRREAERGITYAFLAGAEPALALDRLRAAWEYIPAGMVVTNGTRRIPEDIGFRLHISLWGSEETSRLTRGADVTHKAFRNYAFDERAVFVYTLNPMNLGEVLAMAEACRDHGVPMTFNYYSPTSLYQRALAQPLEQRTDHFRFSTSESNLVMSPEDYKRARETVELAKERFPETIVYSFAYDDWVTGSRVYDLDHQGVATNCAARSDHIHGTFFVDQKRSDLKCSNPTFDCRECRTYASGMTSHVRIEHQRTILSDSKAAWSDAFECWGRLFVGNQWTRLEQATTTPSMSAFP